jgi:hypothetical protein
LNLDENEFKIIVYKPKEDSVNKDTLKIVKRFGDPEA